MTELALVQSNKQTSSGLVEIEQQRAIQEVQASMIIAKRFPRDTDEAYTRIIKACERKTLASSAMYAYPRGGQAITGPSIRLAETVAQNWGNMQYGIRELSQANGESEVEAFAWDIETNTRQVKIFKVPHIRYTKKYGNKKLTDPRDIYEMVANQGARRLRACILGIIPGDIIDAAVSQCEKTLQQDGGTPIEDRVRKMLTKFKNMGVTKEMIEKRLGHNTSAIIETELVELIKVFTSMRDGMSTRDNWFDIPGAGESQESQDLNAKLNKEHSIDGSSSSEPETDNGADNAGTEDNPEKPKWNPATEEVKQRYTNPKQAILLTTAEELGLDTTGKAADIHQRIIDHHAEDNGDDLSGKELERFNTVFTEHRGTDSWHYAQGEVTGDEKSTFRPKVDKIGAWLLAYDEYRANE